MRHVQPAPSKGPLQIWIQCEGCMSASWDENGLHSQSRPLVVSHNYFQHPLVFEHIARSGQNLATQPYVQEGFPWCRTQLRTETERNMNKDKQKINKLALICMQERIISVVSWYLQCHLFMPPTHWTLCQQYSSQAIGSCVEHVQSPHHSSLSFWTVVGSEICSRIPHVRVHNCTCYKRAQFLLGTALH